MRHKINNLLVLGAVVLLLGGCKAEKPPTLSGKTIRIGIIAPFSGSDYAKGKEGLRGMETAMEIQPLLENGDRIEFILKDDKDEPSRAVKALRELVDSDGVSAVVTFSSSGPVLSMARVADRLLTPILAVLATHPGVTTDNQFISQLCFDDRFQGTVAALFVRDELLIERVAVFSNPDSEYSRNLADVFKKKFISIDGRITDSISLHGDGHDIPKILELLHASDPEMLYMPIHADHLIRIIGELDKMNWKPQIIGSDGLLATIMTQYADDIDLLDGLLASDFFHSDMQLTPYGKKVARVFRGKGTTYTVLGIESYALLIHAMNRCRNPSDRSCVNQAIRSTYDLSGVTGRITINSKGKAQRSLVINTIKKGRLKFLVKVY